MHGDRDAAGYNWSLARSRIGFERECRVPALKIAVQLSSLRMPLRKALVAAARMGVHGVEIDARGELRPQVLSQTGMRELKRMLEDHNLKVSAVSFRTRRGYDVPDEIDRRVAATKTAMKFAADLRAGVVVNQVGHVPAESSGSSWNQLIDSLTEICKYGMHVGALLAAQTGTETGADLARLLDALPEGGMGVDLDPGNLISNSFSAQEAAAALGAKILHVHARDGVRDLARGRGLEVPLGRGSADFPALLGTLEDHQYRGFFTIAREDSDNPAAEIAAAVEYLTNL